MQWSTGSSTFLEYSDRYLTQPNPNTGSRVRLLIPRLAAQTAGLRFLSHNLARAISPTSSVYCRSPCIYIIQFNSQPPAFYVSGQWCGTTCSPCLERFPRKRRCRSRYMLDKWVKCVGCSQSDFLSRSVEWDQAWSPLIGGWGRVGTNSSAGDSSWQRGEDASVSHRTCH
jgi:hypothetical protein